MMSPKKYTAGDEIDSRCLKCKNTTNHMIVAMVGDQVAKVLCNTCGSRHNHRPITVVKNESKKVVNGKMAARAAATAPKGKGKTARKILDYEALMGKLDPTQAIAYSMTTPFQLHDLINHTVFGLGLVTAIIQPNKIEVRFREESKILICALGPQ